MFLSQNCSLFFYLGQTNEELNIGPPLILVRGWTKIKWAIFLSEPKLKGASCLRCTKMKWANSAISSFTLHNIISLITLASQCILYAGGSE